MHYVEEGEIMLKGKEILKDVVSGIKEGYDMYSSVSEWIDEEVFELFDELLSKGIDLDLKEKKLLLNGTSCH